MFRAGLPRKIRIPGIPPYTGWAIGIVALVSLLVLLFPTGSGAPGNERNDGLDAGFSLAYAFDDLGTTSLERARRLAFTEAPEQVLHLGFSERALWLRVTMRNGSGRPLDGVLVYSFPYIDTLTAFVPTGDGSGLRRIVRGDSQPLPQVMRHSHFPAFPVHLNAEGVTTAYLRVESTSVLLAPLELMSRDRFERAALLDQVLFGMLFGAVIAVSLYVLTVYLTVRDKAYLDFVPFSLSYALYVAVATGFGQVWIWPGAYQHANLIYFVVQGLLFASGVRFFQRFLNTAEHTPRIHFIMRLLVVAGLLTTVAPFLPKPVDAMLIAFVAGPGAILVLGTAIYLWVRRVDNADVVTIGWAFSHVTSVYLYLRIFDITPYLEINHYLAAIGCAIATLYFAIALALGLRRQQAKLLLAEAINDTRNQFLAGMNHELRTPLNAIMGFSEMMKEQMLGPIEPPAYRSYAEDIHTSSRNMLRLVDDVLDISRIEAGQYTLNPVPTDLIGLAGSCLAEHEAAAAGSGVALRLKHDRAVPDTTVDPDAVSQALRNVIDNAVKFSPEGGTVTVEISVARGDVRLSVTDEGDGIPADMLDRVVRPFEIVRVDAYAAKDGPALGLPLARMLIELHGGRLEIGAEKPSGTRVTFVLPE